MALWHIKFLFIFSISSVDTVLYIQVSCYFQSNTYAHVLSLPGSTLITACSENLELFTLVVQTRARLKILGVFLWLLTRCCTSDSIVPKTLEQRVLRKCHYPAVFSFFPVSSCRCAVLNQTHVKSQHQKGLWITRQCRKSQLWKHS